MIRLTLAFKDRILKVYHPTGSEIRIGRSPDCDIQIDNLGVNPLHARIAVDGGRATIINVSDDGQIEVNGEPVQEHDLEHGDSIVIGKHTLTFSREATATTTQPEPAPTPARTVGWLQFLTGPKLGRTVRLDKKLVRIGKTGKQSAMIANRGGGYYISHLEGESPTRVGEVEIGEDSYELTDGDTIQIGETQVLFFLDQR